MFIVQTQVNTASCELDLGAVGASSLAIHSEPWVIEPLLVDGTSADAILPGVEFRPSAGLSLFKMPELKEMAQAYDSVTMLKCVEQGPGKQFVADVGELRLAYPSPVQEKTSPARRPYPSSFFGFKVDENAVHTDPGRELGGTKLFQDFPSYYRQADRAPKRTWIDLDWP